MCDIKEDIKEKTRRGTSTDAAEVLFSMREEVSRCEGCPLHETRTLPVFGSGNPEASVMIVGEAPGRNEDETGEPFVGKAGQRLTEMLSLAGLSRDEVYIANILKCRPPKNRNPRPDEIRACTGFLDRQIGAVSPDVIVTFGNFASQFVLGTKTGVSEIHGQMFDGLALGSKPDGGSVTVSVYPVFHPAATIYRPQWKPVLEEDMRHLGDILRERTEAGD